MTKIYQSNKTNIVSQYDLNEQNIPLDLSTNSKETSSAESFAKNWDTKKSDKQLSNYCSDDDDDDDDDDETYDYESLNSGKSIIDKVSNNDKRNNVRERNR